MVFINFKAFEIDFVFLSL